MSLLNKTILVTRRKEQARELLDEIGARGGRGIILPMIEIVPPESWEACDAAFAALHTYDAIVFASVNAVEAFIGRSCEKHGGPGSLEGLSLYAVGPKTAEALRQHGLRVAHTANPATAASLAADFGQRDVRGMKFLQPHGDIGTDEIAAKLLELGAQLDTVIVYRTIAPVSGEDDPAAKLLLAGGVDVITFASPSAVRNFAALFPPTRISALHRRTRVAVIGPTTGEAARELGFAPDILARESTSRGLVAAIEEYYA